MHSLQLLKSYLMCERCNPKIKYPGQFKVCWLSFMLETLNDQKDIQQLAKTWLVSKNIQNS